MLLCLPALIHTGGQLRWTALQRLGHAVSQVGACASALDDKARSLTINGLDCVSTAAVGHVGQLLCPFIIISNTQVSGIAVQRTTSMSGVCWPS